MKKIIAVLALLALSIVAHAKNHKPPSPPPPPFHMEHVSATVTSVTLVNEDTNLWFWTVSTDDNGVSVVLYVHQKAKPGDKVKLLVTTQLNGGGPFVELDPDSD